ncbi:MAG TPA: N-acetylneuraminate synthase family protein, partial [Streptosporangiaceae bacterium]
MAAVTVVAELGINHGGSPEKARLMIDVAAECGCGGVKVQSFRCHEFLPEGHPDWMMFERCEIWPWLEHLADRAHRKGLLFGVTPQSAESVQEAVDAGADYLKVGSDCLTHTRLMRAALESGLPVWVSTGMAT